MAAQRRHLSRQLCRLVFGARRGLLRRRRNRRRRRQGAARAAGHAGRLGRGEELFLQAVGLSGQAARALREPAGFHRSGFAQERGRQLRQRRAAGSVDLAHHLRLGRQGAQRSRACDVCLGRCADQLHHRRRLSRRERRELALLAGRRAHHRQGHHPLPRGVLAGLPDVGGHSPCRSASMPTASCSTGARRCRNRSATSSIPSISPTSMASTRCAISSCARCRSGRTAATITKPSSRASMPISPTISAIWRSARCR